MNSVMEMNMCIQSLMQGYVNIKAAILTGVIRRSSNHYGYGYHHYSYNYADKN